MDTAKPVGHLAQGGQHRTRLEYALLLVGIVNPSGDAGIALPEVLVVAGNDSRFELLPRELVDGIQQQPLVAGELLRVLSAPAGEDHRHQIVRAQTLLDELMGGRSHPRRALRRDVQIIEDHHVDAAIEGALVRLDIALDRTR